jgi:ankyrin repeat protein
MALLPSQWDFDEDFGGALHMARSLKMGKFLLEQGAEVNEMSDFGRTPLHVAVEHGDLAMAALLLESGAAVNADGHRSLGPSFFHSTPLQCALKLGCDDTKLSMAKLLIEHGAIPTTLDFIITAIWAFPV